MADIRVILAENVKKFRLRKGLSREELSLLVGVDNSYISKLERKKVNITIDKMSIIAKTFDVKVFELIK